MGSRGGVQVISALLELGNINCDSLGLLFGAVSYCSLFFMDLFIAEDLILQTLCNFLVLH